MPLIYGFRVSKAAEQGQISNSEVRASSASETRLKNPMARDNHEDNSRPNGLFIGSDRVRGTPHFLQQYWNREKAAAPQLSALPGTLDSVPQHISPSHLLHERQHDGRIPSQAADHHSHCQDGCCQEMLMAITRSWCNPLCSITSK